MSVNVVVQFRHIAHAQVWGSTPNTMHVKRKREGEERKEGGRTKANKTSRTHLKTYTSQKDFLASKPGKLTGFF